MQIQGSRLIFESSGKTQNYYCFALMRLVTNNVMGLFPGNAQLSWEAFKMYFHMENIYSIIDFLL